MASRCSPSYKSARRTESTSTTDTVEGSHRFVIRNYSRVRGLAIGEFVRSGTFTVAGYDWCVFFYPSGTNSANGYTPVVYVRLMTRGVTARMTFSVLLVNQVTGLTQSRQLIGSQVLSTRTRTLDEVGMKVIEARELEESYVAGDDSLTIECAVSVILAPRTSGTTRRLPDREIEAPASDLPAHLGRLLVARERADVTFDVRGEKFAAHRLVLAARSPVFKAELFGPMSDDRGCITIHDVLPAVFGVLLDFIYTDSLPDMDDPDEGADGTELARHLLAAADRYGMDRLKVLCEGILSRGLTAQTVASTMALADRHSCQRLKDACVEYVIFLGLNNDAVASREDGQLNCLSFIKYLWKEIGSILKTH